MPANVYEEFVIYHVIRLDCVSAHLLEEAAEFICSPLSQLSIDSGCLSRD